MHACRSIAAASFPCRSQPAHKSCCHVQAPQLTPFPDLTQPKTAFPLYVPPPSSGPALVARLEDLYLKPRDLPELAAMARQAVANATSAALEAQKQQQQQQPGGEYGAEDGGGGSSSSAAIVAEQLQAEYIVLDLPCTLFSLRTARWVRQPWRSSALRPRCAAVLELCAAPVLQLLPTTLENRWGWAGAGSWAAARGRA